MIKHVKAGHVWINDENISWINNYNESNAVHSGVKRKKNGGAQGWLTGREKDVAEQNVGSSSFWEVRWVTFHKLFRIHPLKGCFLIVLRIQNQRYCSDTCSDTILWFRDHCSHTVFPSLPTTYLLSHTLGLAGEATTREPSGDLFSFWIFLHIWPEQNKSGHSGGEAQAAFSVCGSLIQE